jgi:hypothetical protein
MKRREVSGEYPIPACTVRRVFASATFRKASAPVDWYGGIYLGYRLDQISKESLFAAVRWQQSQPEVKSATVA